MSVNQCTYKGFVITKTRGFTTSKLTARKDGKVHTRRFRNGEPYLPDEERALELLKEDIDQYGHGN